MTSYGVSAVFKTARLRERFGSGVVGGTLRDVCDLMSVYEPGADSMTRQSHHAVRTQSVRTRGVPG